MCCNPDKDLAEMRKLLLGTVAAFALAATAVYGATIKVADSTVEFDFKRKLTLTESPAI